MGLVVLFGTFWFSNPCQNIKVTLFNDVLDAQGTREGTYKLYQLVNGKNSWKSSSAQAIWYMPQLNSWAIGKFSDIGMNTFGIQSTSDQAHSNRKEKYCKFEGRQN